jgi:chromosome segregation ATPase
MFGFKIVKSLDYSSLERQLQSARDLLTKKDSEINFLTSENNGLNAKIDALQERIAKLEAKETPKTVLLTDVAETPLIVEKETKKKTVKKSETKTTRKKTSKSKE